MGKQDGQDPVTGVIHPIRDPPLPPHPAHGRGRGGPVVPVGDVQHPDLEKGISQAGDVRVAADNPDGMGDAIVGGEVVFRLPRGDPRHDCVDCLLRPVRHEDRPGLRAGDLHVPGAFQLLVRPRQFMLLDPAGLVFGRTDSGDDAGLAVVAHALAVDVITGPRILNQRAVRDETVQILPGPQVHPILCRFIGGRRCEIDLRLLHMEKTEGIAGCQPRRLLPVDDIVGWGRDHPGKLSPRPQQPQGNHVRHSILLVRNSLANFLTYRHTQRNGKAGRRRSNATERENR